MAQEFVEDVEHALRYPEELLEDGEKDHVDHMKTLRQKCCDINVRRMDRKVFIGCEYSFCCKVTNDIFLKVGCTRTDDCQHQYWYFFIDWRRDDVLGAYKIPFDGTWETLERLIREKM